MEIKILPQMAMASARRLNFKRGTSQGPTGALRAGGKSVGFDPTGQRRLQWAQAPRKGPRGTSAAPSGDLGRTQRPGMGGR